MMCVSCVCVCVCVLYLFLSRVTNMKFAHNVISSSVDSRNVTDKDKRSSMNRPVLRLQVKQETLERQGIMTNGGSIHMVSKGTLRNIARESGICAGEYTRR